MIVDTPSRSLQIVLGEAHATRAADIIACYGQQTATGGFLTSLSHAPSSGTSPVTIVAAPAIGSQYLVNEIRVYNADTVAHTVTLRLLDGTTARVVWSSSVTAGDCWTYTPHVGEATVTGGSVSISLSAVNVWLAAQRGAVVSLTDAATIAVDFSAGNNFAVTLGGNRTLGNPSNVGAGQAGQIVISQDGTGSRTLAYASDWKFAGGTAPTLSTAAGAVDILSYYVWDTTHIAASLQKTFS